jgi:hypothetical protein
MIGLTFALGLFAVGAAGYVLGRIEERRSSETARRRASYEKATTE